jgi:glycosyltransferase involved in cell wall biosynthesis
LKLSVIVPAYNEVTSLALILNKVAGALPSIEKEIIVVDDCSKDGTREYLQDMVGDRIRYACPVAGSPVQITDTPAPGVACTTIRSLFHERNQGKGAALRTGLRAATGDVFVIQDADLEYDPADWRNFWPLIAEGHADVVYGSRFSGAPHRCLYFHHFLANRLISLLFSILYNQILSDLEVCYKMFNKKALASLTLRSNDFGFEIEFSANVARARWLRIYELPVAYYGRTYTEGKKINWKDGVKALFYLFLYRLL